MSRSRSAPTINLLTQVEPLTYRARIMRMVELGRSLAKGDAEARRILVDLHESSEAYDRLLALMSVFGKRQHRKMAGRMSVAIDSLHIKKTRYPALRGPRNSYFHREGTRNTNASA